MSPTNLHDHQAKTNNMHPPPSLKVNKNSYMVKKSSSSSLSSPPSSSSSSSASSLGIMGPVKPPQRHPVIIYTHSPKIIHTHPKDFMALVQKLTGLSQSEDDPAPQVKQANRVAKEENKKVKINVDNDDNGSSSAITDEICGSIGDGQVNSYFMPPIFQPPNPNCMTNIPVYAPNLAEFLCGNPPVYNYTDPLFYPSPNMRNSISTSATLDVKNEFCGY